MSTWPRAGPLGCFVLVFRVHLILADKRPGTNSDFGKNPFLSLFSSQVVRKTSLDSPCNVGSSDELRLINFVSISFIFPATPKVRGEDEAMEVDEEGREGEGPDGGEEDGKEKEEEDDLPDDLNLDNADDVGGYVKI